MFTVLGSVVIIYYRCLLACLAVSGKRGDGCSMCTAAWRRLGSPRSVKFARGQGGLLRTRPLGRSRDWYERGDDQWDPVLDENQDQLRKVLRAW